MILSAAIWLSAFHAPADIVNSVSCATPTAALSIGISTCYSPGSYGYSSGSVNSTELFPSDASQAAIINAVTSVSALQFGVHGIAGTATAQASTDIGISFATAGQARAGLLEVTFLQNTWQAPVNGYIDQLLSVAGYSVDPAGISATPVWIPIELGSQFGFDYLQNVTAIGSSASGFTSGLVDSSVLLQAFEADGVTGAQLFDPPAALVATPEPASFGMMTAGVLGVALLLKLRRQKNSPIR